MEVPELVLNCVLSGASAFAGGIGAFRYQNWTAAREKTKGRLAALKTAQFEILDQHATLFTYWDGWLAEAAKTPDPYRWINLQEVAGATPAPPIDFSGLFFLLDGNAPLLQDMRLAAQRFGSLMSTTEQHREARREFQVRLEEHERTHGPALDASTVIAVAGPRLKAQLSSFVGSLCDRVPEQMAEHLALFDRLSTLLRDRFHDPNPLIYVSRKAAERQAP